MLRHDLAGLTGVLADVCPVDDDVDHENVDEYPLPADHWINVPLGKEGAYKSLLHLGLETGNTDIGIQSLLNYMKTLIKIRSPPPYYRWSESRPTQ